MKPTWILILLLAAALLLAVSMPQAGANKENSVNAPVYTADGSLKLPANYREWVYLSSGLDMSYSPNAMNMDHSMFDNVFANRSEEHTSELQSLRHLVCRLLLEKKNKKNIIV